VFVQVRHPLERLLSAWRFIFQNQAWRQIIEHLSEANPIDSITDEDHRLLNISWPDFVSQADTDISKISLKGQSHEIFALRLLNNQSQLGYLITRLNHSCKWLRNTHV
jgi:hypothetical protein